MAHLRAAHHRSLGLWRRSDAPPRALALCAALLATLAAGCRSAPADARVTLRSFTGEDVLELTLVSRSYIERTQPEMVAPEEFKLGSGELELDLPTEADFYSQQRDSASTKVAPDARMRALLEGLDDEGFQRRSRPGQAPSRAEQGYRKTLEVETDEGVRHFSLQSGAERGDLLAHQAMAVRFQDVFNGIYALQSVQPRPVEEVFQQPEVSERLRD